MLEITIPVFISTCQECRANAVLDHKDQHGGRHVLSSSIPSSHWFSEEVQQTTSARGHVETLRGMWVEFTIPGNPKQQSAKSRVMTVCSVDPVELTDHFSPHNGRVINIKYSQINIPVNTKVMYLPVFARVQFYPISIF